MYDVIVIGMGISGITCSIYLKRAGFNVLMLESNVPGGVINTINQIDNYPGYKSISGPSLAFNLFESINENEIEYKIEKVTDVIFDELKTVNTNKGVYHAKYIVIASGRSPKMLGLKDEEKFIGKGISTCAICDGPLYKNKDIAVIGGGSSALSESLYLSKIVNKVYLIHRRNEFRGENLLIEKVKNTNNIELILNKEVKSINIKDNDFKGIYLNDNTLLDISAMFIYIGFNPNTLFLKNSSVKLNNNYIIVNSNYETNIDGVYACGDCIDKDIYQIVTGASEGASVAINISKKENSI